MRIFSTIVAGVSLALIGTSASAATAAEKGEARLAKMLEGRTAGEPVSCISATRPAKLEVIEGVGVVYDGGETVYVARVDNPNSINRSDAVVVERFGSQLCRQDVTRTFDRYGGFITGSVFLSDFVPYKKAG